jgi:hypothetical protein
MSANYNIIQGGTTFNLDVNDILNNTNSEIRLVCKTSTGPITINLPPISTFGVNINASIFVDDTDDLAGTNNITINASLGNTIENAPSYVINANGGKIEIFISTFTEFGVLGVGTGGGPALPSWLLNGNTNGLLKSIGTLDNFDLPFILNGQEVGRMVPKVIGSLFDGEGRFLWGQTQTDNGSNAGFQTSCTRPNRAQFRFNQYGANNAGGGITSFKSRSLVIGSVPAPADAVIVGDIIQGQTAIAVTNNALVPLAYTQRVIVVENANGNVAADWEISLCPKGTTTNSIRKTFRISSEGVPQLRELGSPSPQATTGYVAGLVTLDGAGQFVVPNTNVQANTRFLLTVQDGGAIPSGSLIYQSARVVGTSFTITSKGGALDSGVQVYYQLLEPIV